MESWGLPSAHQGSWALRWVVEEARPPWVRALQVRRCLGGRCRRRGIRSGRSIRRGAGRFGWHLGCGGWCLRCCRVAGTPGTSALIAAGVLAAGAVAGAAPAAEAAPTLFRSLMFLDSSAIRALASLACCLRQLVFSTLLAFERTLREGQLVWGGCRLAVFHLGLHLATGRALGRGHCCARCGISQLAAEGVEVPALGSRIWQASVLDTDLAVASSGICSTEPARTRFTLPWINASGLARIMATSI